MTIYDYEAAFGAADKTTKAMRTAVENWKKLYYGTAADGEDPCQRLAYTIVTKLTKAAFCEYKASAEHQVTQGILQSLEPIRTKAFATALVEGECYLKPWPGPECFSFELIPGSNVLIFGRDGAGDPTDVGLVETSIRGEDYFTLLERRSLQKGQLSITYQLFKSRSADKLGQQVSLKSHPFYEELSEQYRYPVDTLGIARMKLPVENCVDGSFQGVSVYAAAADLIRNIDENEHQLRGEFTRGESRVIASKDMLTGGVLQDHLFVGLDEDPENVGITVFSPQLRVDAYLARKQEYLRNVESIVGLRRGMLSDANVEERTATEIASSTGDFNLTVLECQQMWEKAMAECVEICRKLAAVYGMEEPAAEFAVDWGNGILYDETVQWAEYLEMVKEGILKPEVALGWRFGMAADTPQEQAAVREKYMPEGQ